MREAASARDQDIIIGVRRSHLLERAERVCMRVQGHAAAAQHKARGRLIWHYYHAARFQAIVLTYFASIMKLMPGARADNTTTYQLRAGTAQQRASLRSRPCSPIAQRRAQAGPTAIS